MPLLMHPFGAHHSSKIELALEVAKNGAVCCLIARIWLWYLMFFSMVGTDKHQLRDEKGPVRSGRTGPESFNSKILS